MKAARGDPAAGAGPGGVPRGLAPCAPRTEAAVTHGLGAVVSTRQSPGPRRQQRRRAEPPTGRGPGAQAKATESPSTVIRAAGSGWVAGPLATLPSLMLNLLPWQGQLIVPSATWLTAQP